MRKSKVLIIAFSILSAVILVASLLVQVKLTEATDENVSLRKKLSELCDENTRLKIEYESSVSLPELEEYAKTVLGMQNPQSETTVKSEVPVRDKAEILRPTAKTDAEKLVSSIMEYSGEIKCKFN